MKKIFAGLTFIVFFILLSWPMKSLCQASLTIFSGLPKNEEITLNFGNPKITTRLSKKWKYYYTSKELEKALDGFHAHFKYKNKDTELDATHDQIKVSDLTKLYNSLNMADKPNSIGLLKMIFGRVNKKLVIFYQPVAFTRIGDKRRKFSIDEHPTNAYYWINPDSNKFEEFLDTAKRDSIIRNYTNSSDMYIIHNTDSTKDITQFVGAYTPSRTRLEKEEEDVSYCLFTFSHLTQMMKRLKIKNEGDPAITFSIVASNYFYWGGKNRTKAKNHKLHVIAHYNLDGKGNKPITIGAKNYGADFTQMPPEGVKTINLNAAK
ncbi:hypothetical protein [Niabella hirudinis]|uniref:hypothetical protein n=1 Tax=Niabella hirudinis TaxID=1285929 RepID=UPI003EBF6161